MSYISALLLIGFTILFHEFGHFLAARIVKIPIKIFSVGFGPALWKKQLGKTEYRISLIPMGGYVLPDIEDENHFFKIPIAKRIIMTAGGPIASALLPTFCLAAISWYTVGFSFIGILINPFLKTWFLAHQMIASIPLLFSNPEHLSGIVGIVAQGGTFVGSSPIRAMQFVAMMSMNLCIMNILPIPALDGGKILLFMSEKIHPSFVRLHLPLSIAGWVLIMGLTVYTVVMDVLKFAA